MAVSSLRVDSSVPKIEEADGDSSHPVLEPSRETTFASFRGLDLLVQLNFAKSRDFLLQVEDELEAFIFPNEATACTSNSPITKTEETSVGGAPITDCTSNGSRDTGTSNSTSGSLAFPPLGSYFEELLTAVVRRYGLKATIERNRKQQRVMVVHGPRAANQGTEAIFPCFSLADFLRVQRQPGPEPEPDTVSSRSRRMRLRLWAIGVTSSTDDVHAAATAAADDPVALQASIDVALAAQAAEEGAENQGWSSEEEFIPQGSAVKRGRGFDGNILGSTAPSANVRHCYHRFGPNSNRQIYLRDNFVKGSWPTAKLQRAANPSVEWREEWRVGPDEGEELERGSMGGILSWAVEPSNFRFGEGFEVNLRSGPGPSESSKDLPERCDSDFLLSFRRSKGAWHFTAGRRTARPGVQKTIEDRTGDPRRRHMFWVACFEARADGKHYVIVGRMPQLLSEHFFAAKIARVVPLSHAGFSYLPEPRAAAFGEGPVQLALVIESITVHPRGLTGELPFVSLRHVDERLALTEDDHSQPLVKVKVESTKEPNASGKLGEGPGRDPEQTTEVVVWKNPLPAGDDLAARIAAWGPTTRRECGFPPSASDPSVAEERMAKRARQRVEAPVIAPNSMQAPASWEPQTASAPQFGPFDETLRHAPQIWDPYVTKSEL